MHSTSARRAARLAALLPLLLAPGIEAGWTQYRGDPRRSGFTPEAVGPPFRLSWAVEFDGERLGTAAEAVVAGELVFVTTHAGRLHALDAGTGEPRWHFEAPGPLLHSAAAAGSRVVVASAGGGLFALEAGSGTLAWEQNGGDEAGYAAPPLVEGGRVWIGGRSGRFVACDLATGRLLWSRDLGVPVRQGAALTGKLVVVTGEDLRVRALEAESGATRWITGPLSGQSARDGAAVVVGSDASSRVVIRTAPALNMARQIALDRAFLARQACADDSDWRRLDAWIKSPAARGTPELWAAEQAAIRARLREHPASRTFHVLDAASGQAAPPAPVFWAAGCQGVGTLPALIRDGRSLLLYRSAYGNWNHGVAPLVALGLWDPAGNGIEPLFHDRGPQPPWNTFWGTADESQAFTVAGDLAFIVHQGTLSGLDLNTRRLFPILGERDTFGGFPNPAWARNEWHGPGRGGVGVAGGRVFWITGSRLLCLASGQTGPPAGVRTVRAAETPGAAAALPPPRDPRPRLAEAVDEFLGRRWAPLWVQPGLAGREFFFDHSSDTFAALAWAWPHLDPDRRERVRAWLAAEWDRHPPLAPGGALDLRDGARREWCPAPAEELAPPAAAPTLHPLLRLDAVWRYASRMGETNRVLAAWPEIRRLHADWQRAGWRLDPARGDLQANRTISGLLACARLAEAAGDTGVAAEATAEAEVALTALGAWWRRAAAEAVTGRLSGVRDLDSFIGRGDALSFRVTPHRHKIALFLGLTPEITSRLLREVPEAVEAVWARFARLHATWWLVGEERQVHYGENLVDPPDLALGAFAAWAWLKAPPAEALARRVDLPWGGADLYHITKLALTLDVMAASRR